MLPPEKDDERDKTPPDQNPAERREPEPQPEEPSPTETTDDPAFGGRPGEEPPRDGAADSGDVARRSEEEPEPVASEPPGEPVSDPFSAPRQETGATTGETVGGAYDPALREGAGPAEGPPEQSEPVVETERAAPPAPPPAARSGRGGGFFPALLAAIFGGVIGAAGIWYYLEQQGPVGPDPEMVAAVEEQGATVAAQEERLAEIQGDIDALNDALSNEDLSGAIQELRMDAEGEFGALAETLSTIGERFDALEAGLGSVRERLDQADQQIAELEARPIADPETATEVLRSEVAAMRQEVEAATAEARAQVEAMRDDLAAAAEQTQAEIAEAEQRAAELEAQAEERARAAEAEALATARAAEALAALAQVELAIDSGEPYAAELSILAGNLDQEVPEPLSEAAETGVPTLAELRETYPDAARAALRATAVATTEGEPADRLVAFLRTQTQARSLTPQAGDSADAVLSRAEAALRDGDVEAALAELQALPEDGLAAMQDWLDAARLRADAAEAADALSQALN